MSSLKLFLYRQIDRPYIAWTFAAVLSLYIILVFAVDAGDNDLWWHLKYGENSINNSTIKPDHTVYSWTPSDKDWIYVTWLSDLVLYGLYSFGGMPLLSIFRYLCFFSIIALLVRYGINVGQRFTPAVFLIAIVTINQLSGFYALKPELISVVFFTVAIYIYFLGRRDSVKIFYLYPFLFLVWVNAHGIFLFGLVFISVVLAGETAAFFAKSNGRLSKNLLIGLALSVGLSYAAVILNPYGLRYPVELYKTLTSPVFIEYARTVNAVKSPADMLKESALFLAPGLLNKTTGVVLMIAVAGIVELYMIFIKKRVRIPIILAQAVFAVLFFQTLRTMFFYPIIWGFSMVDALDRKAAESAGQQLFRIGSAVLFLALAAIFILNNSKERIWFGSGISEFTPEKAISVLRKNDLMRYPLFNDYYLGGYLLWALYPEQKVFIDPRGGPYLSGLFQDYKKTFLADTVMEKHGDVLTYDTKSISGRVELLRDFNSKYPFKVAVVHIGSDHVVMPFLLSGEWRLLYFDANAVIFVHASIDVSYAKEDLGPQRFKGTRQIAPLLRVFTLYLNTGNLKAAEHILGIMETGFGRHNKVIDYCRRMLDEAKGMQRPFK